MGPFAKDHQKDSMASFNFDFPPIDAGTTFVFGSWVCIANGSGGFSSHLINVTSTKAPQQEQLGGITSVEILLPGIVKEIKNLSLLDPTPTRFPFGLKNSAMSYSCTLPPIGLDWDSDSSPVRLLPELRRRLRLRLGFTQLPKPEHPGHTAKPSRLLEEL